MSQSSEIRVLFIEDDRGTARLVQKLLRESGYAVEIARDGQTGLDELDRHAYDIALVDYLMPGMNGLDVLQRMKEREMLPPTIIVTGAGDEPIAVEAMKLGATDYLVKDPAGMYLNLLPMTIERSLEKHRLLAEKAKTEIALRENEERLLRLTAIAGSVLFKVAFPSGRYEYVSPAVLDIMGYTAEEFLSNPDLPRDIVHPDWRDYYDEEWQNLLDGVPPSMQEYQIVHRSGAIKWIRLHLHLCNNDEGLPVAVEGIATDITEDKRAEEALQESEERFRLLIERAGDALFLFDMTGKIILVNSQACRALGYSREELLALSVQDVQIAWDQEALKELWDNLEPTDPPRTLHGEHRRKDGSTFPVESRLDAFPWKQQKLFLVLARDQSESKSV